jgi:predicted Zn-dependent protease
MSKRVTNAILALAVLGSSLTAAPAKAEVDAAQIQKRKEVIHGCLLQIYLDKKQRPQAIAEYQVMIGLKPEDPKMRYAYGRYVAASQTPGDIATGITQLKKAVQLDPGNPVYNGVLGALYLKAKNPGEALKWLKLAVQYGGLDYKKTYEETYKYIEGTKRIAEIKKRNDEIKKQAAPAAGATNADGSKKGGDDDDDDW